MTFGIERRKSSSGYDHRRLPPNARQRAWGAVTIVSVAALCAWTLCSSLANTGADQTDVAPTRGDKLDLAVRRGDKLDVAVGRGDKLVVAKPSVPTSNIRISLFDPRASLGVATGTFANSVPLQGDGNLPAPMPLLPSSLTAAHNTRDIQPIPARAPKNGLADAAASISATAELFGRWHAKKPGG